MIAEQDAASIEPSQPETMSATVEAEGTPEDVVQSELVDAPLETPTNGRSAMELKSPYLSGVWKF